MNRNIQKMVLILIFVLLTGCELQDSYSGQVILSGYHELRGGQTIEGDLLMLGGAMRLYPGSRVTGSVHLLDGAVDASGDIHGNVTVVTGRLALQPSAVVQGNVTVAGGELAQAAGARIVGQLNQTMTEQQTQPSTVSQGGRLLTVLLSAPFLASLAFAAVRFLPGFVANIGQAGTHYFLVSLSLGILGWVVGLSLLLLMAYTILLLPLTLIGFLMMLLAATYGAVPYALALGQAFSQRLSWSITAPWQAGLGMLVLVVLVELLRFVPVIGGLLPLGLFAAALGAVLLTRFGIHRFVPPDPDFVKGS